MSKAIFIFIYILLLPIITYSQEVEESKNRRRFNIQGSFYNDYDIRNTSANKIGAGYVMFKEQHISQLLFEFSFLEDKRFKSSKLLVEVEYFKSYLQEEVLNHTFLAGPTVNFNYTYEQGISSYKRDDYTEKCFCFRGGLKAMYILSIWKDLKLVISSDVNLFDFGVSHFYNDSPSAIFNNEYEFEGRFLRRRLGLDVGFIF